MRKALTSFAAGQDYIDLLSIALPRFYEYSHKHNYDLVVFNIDTVISICESFGWDHDRPASWLKIPIMKYLLSNLQYDLVQWIDCDVVINNLAVDINQDFVLSSQHQQAMVYHYTTNEGVVPNCGIWSVKTNAIPLLENIWNQTDFINHKWWEQGANIHLMENEDIKNISYELPFMFNVHKNDTRFNIGTYLYEGIMLHATMWPNRKQQMIEWNNYAYTH